MNRIIEADFLPPPVEKAQEKPRILIIDDNRDFTLSANSRWRAPGATPFGKKTIQRELTKQRSALSLTLFFLILQCRKPIAAKSPRGFVLWLM